MAPDDAQHSWFGPSLPDPHRDPTEDSSEFARLWRGFVIARLTLGSVLVALQMALYATGSSHNRLLIPVSLAYCLATVATHWQNKPRALGGAFNRSWFALAGVDIVAFSALQILQEGNINYTPLFALPILLASVLGSLRLALGTAAGVTVLLLANALWTFFTGTGDKTAYFVQAAFSGTGYFIIALLANQLSTRLASEVQRARQNQEAASIQRQVNELVIDSLPDGVLIVDERGAVRAANPAARQLLGTQSTGNMAAFNLRDQPAWGPLWHMTRTCISSREGQEDDITLRQKSLGPQRIRVRSRLAAPQGAGAQSLCVLFLQDLRELEARMRTEKLASMGRMSTAVAHEIRNPLAAIAQANALLDEDITDEKLKKLTAMVAQNTKRLGRIVDDILNVAHVLPSGESLSVLTTELAEATHRICKEWGEQAGAWEQLRVDVPQDGPMVRFEADHLRRVLVNLLDNARRHASGKPGSIQVRVEAKEASDQVLSVWSDGPMMDQSVERHLFEPFFSSESRSSGLGLYICRELCESHGASITYLRSHREINSTRTEGNNFFVSFISETTWPTPSH
jgi:two-component system sensor histidine kinase PilS (NtrC family)